MPNINPSVEQNELHDYEIDGHKISVGWGKAVKINSVPFYTSTTSSSTSDKKNISQQDSIAIVETITVIPKDDIPEVQLEAQNSFGLHTPLNEVTSASRINIVGNNWDAKPLSQVRETQYQEFLRRSI